MYGVNVMAEHERPKRLQYIEALDTVRYRDPRTWDIYCHQAEAEMMLSLLFGMPIVIPEPFAFDSRAFLAIALRCLAARPVARRNYLSPVWNPFVLALHGTHQTYADGITERFRAGNFNLSALNNITDEKRQRFVKALRLNQKRDWNYLHAVDEETAIVADGMRRLRDYFSARKHASPPLIRTDASGHTPQLRQYISSALAKRRLRDTHFSTIREGLRLLYATCTTEIPNTRSWAYDHADNIADPEMRMKVLEYIDACYNRVLMASVQTDDAVLTGCRSSTVLDALAGERFAAVNQGKTPARVSPLQVQVIPGPFTEHARLSNLQWETIWDIVSDRKWAELTQAVFQPASRWGARMSSRVELITFLTKALPDNFSLAQADTLLSCSMWKANLLTKLAMNILPELIKWPTIEGFTFPDEAAEYVDIGLEHVARKVNMPINRFLTFGVLWTSHRC